MLLADVALVKNTLTVAGVNVEDPVIKSILDSLTQDAETIGSARPIAVQATWFGQSHTGGYRLATNADLAHQTVIEAFEAMVKELRRYREDIERFAEEQRAADETSATYSTVRTDAVSCVSAPTFSAPACTTPTGDEA